MTRLRIGGLCCALVLALPAVAQATPIHQPSLHVYQTGKKVKGLQYLLTGNKPSVTKHVTYHGRLTGAYDLKTRLAVKQMKFRMGWPKSSLNGKVAGPYFFAVMKGKIVRPIEWVGLEAQRTKALVAAANAPPPCVTRILTAARSIGFGFKEIWGANWGPQVRDFQHITHNSYHAAWCVSTTQWINVHAGIGTLADASAGVNYVYVWAQHRGWVHATPRPGAWVAFGYSHSTHMGLVESVNRDGSYVTLEGNHNSGFYRVHRGRYENYPVFLWQPCITR